MESIVDPCEDKQHRQSDDSAVGIFRNKPDVKGLEALETDQEMPTGEKTSRGIVKIEILQKNRGLNLEG